MKKKTIWLLTLSAWTCCFLVATIWADDIAQKRSCESCGMDRKAFGYSRMLVSFTDGSRVATCSLNCTVEELEKQKGKKVREFLVADYNTRTLIDAPSSSWVMGGDRRGVMTMRPKWAFAGKGAAEAFVKAHGGAVVTWKTALAAAQADAAASR